MVNNERLIAEFIRLTRIDSVSKQERTMADTLKEILGSMGYEATEDDAGEKIGGKLPAIFYVRYQAIKMFPPSF